MARPDSGVFRPLQQKTDGPVNSEDFDVPSNINNSQWCLTENPRVNSFTRRASKIESLRPDENRLGPPMRLVKLLSHDGELLWKQEVDGLAITCPEARLVATAITC